MGTVRKPPRAIKRLNRAAALSGVIAATVLCVAFILAVTLLSRDQDDSGKALLKSQPLIAHAMGGIDKYRYTNSLEAFEFNYGQGLRLFEVDLLPSVEGPLIARHDGAQMWEILKQEIPERLAEDPGGLLTLDEASAKIHGIYTPLTFEDVVSIMTDHPDMYIVTDTKYADADHVTAMFTTLRDTAQAINASVLDRVIPQAYNAEMIDTLRSIYPFKTIILTTYKLKATDEELLAIVKKYRPDGVTMPTNRVKPELIAGLSKLGVAIYTHTINDLDDCMDYVKMGLTGVYTDWLYPALLEG